MYEGLEVLDHDEHMRKHAMKQKTTHEKVVLKAKEILERKIDEKLEKYPSTLTVEHLQKIMSSKKNELYSKSQIYNLLNNGQIPSAKKIPGMGWRIPALTFFAWWLGSGEVK